MCGEINPTGKPDADNIIKAILDALNTYAYKDDAEVVSVTAEKRYSTTPRVEVTLTGSAAGRHDPGSRSRNTGFR